MESVTFQGSKLAFRSQLDLFGLPSTDVSVENSKFESFNSYNIKDPNNPIIFSIRKTTNYNDPGGSLLYVRSKILNSDLTPISKTDIIAPSSLFFHKMFKNVSVSVNNVVVSEDQNQYAYAAVIPILLTKGAAERDTLLSSILYYRDDVYDNFDVSTNIGLKQRIDLSSESRTFDMIGSLSTSLFTMDRYLPPGCNIDIKLTRNTAAFCLDGSVNSKAGVAGIPYTFSIEEIVLYMKQFEVSHEIMKHHQLLLSRGNKAQFPLNSIQARCTQIAAGTQNYVSDILWHNEKMPNFCVFGLVSSSAYNGQLKLNPFNFKPYDLSTITLKCDQQPQLYQSLNMDYDSNLFQFAFQTLAIALGNKSLGSGISRSDFSNGYCLYVFHYLPVATSSDFQPERKGQLRVELGFKIPTTVPLQLISLGTFTNLMEISSSGGVYLS